MSNNKTKAIKRYEEGKAHHQKGKLSAAESAYKKAIKICPDFAGARNNLGNLYLERGRLKEALFEYRKALKLVPNEPMLLNNIANALSLQGEFEKALEWLDKAIKQDPGSAAAHCNLGNALWSLGRDLEAVVAYRRAIELNPDLADAHRNLGGILIELRELEEASNCYNHALRINPKDKIAYQGLGRVRNEQGDLDQAVSAYEKAIAINPANEEYYTELGRAYSDHGEIEKAISAHRKAVEINPKFAKAYRSLAKNKKFKEYDDDIKAMESLLSMKGLSDEDSIYLAYGLGKAYEDLGNFDKSMEFVTRAAQLKRGTFDYSISDSRNQFDRIKEVFSHDFFSKYSAVGNPDQTPIFIVGMPRSGTSLVEQILASHPDVCGAGELDDLPIVFESTKKPVGKLQSDTFPEGLLEIGATEFADLGKQYVARIRRYSAEARFITDKMPHNFLRIGFIRTILPNARVIHCTRNPMDNCLSLYKTYLRNEHRYSYDMTELGEYYKLYLGLMEYWRNMLPGFVYDQSYEDLVKSPQEQVGELLQHCRLSWDDACLDPHKTQRNIKTASNAQVRRPIYKDSVDLWKRYEKQLEPLKTAIYG